MGVIGGIRGVAALLVAASFLALRFGPNELGWRSLATASGDLGVTLAFVLSGFLATRILTATVDESRPIAAFLSRRAFRTLPLVLAYLAILFLSEGPVAMLSGAPVSLTQVEAACSYLWPLGVLWQFYLAWPIVVLTVPRAALIPACLAGVVLSAIFRAATTSAGLDAEMLGRTLPAHLDAFALGAIASAVQLSPSLRVRTSSQGIPAMSFGLLACVASVAYLAISPQGVVDPIPSTFVRSAFAVSSASVIFWATTEGKRNRLLNHPSLRSLGRCGYALFILGPATMFLIPGPGTDATAGQRFGLMLASVAVAVVLTKLGYECVDRPFGRFRRSSSLRDPKRLEASAGRPIWPELRGYAPAGS